MGYIYTLCSSSKGNCTYVGDDESGILIDAGIGIRNFASQLALAQISAKKIKAVCVTHEHSDHISGLSKIQKALNVPVIATKGTTKGILQKQAVGNPLALEVIGDEPKIVDNFEITAFKTSHDSLESCGYKINFEGKSVAICTDLGYISPIVHETLSGCNFVMLESNYEKNMLDYGLYPAFLKQRIKSNVGHLSNIDCAKEIAKLYESGVEHFMLGHLSQDNNMPEIALGHSVAALTHMGLTIDKDYTLHIAPRMNNGNIKINF